MSKIVLWCSNLSNQKAFYSQLFDVEVPDTTDFAEVSDGTNCVLLHALPSEFASSTDSNSPLAAKEDVAIKPVFTVSSMEAAISRISQTLAVISPLSAQFGGYEYRDVIDPEGNVIQIQQKH